MAIYVAFSRLTAGGMARLGCGHNECGSEGIMKSLIVVAILLVGVVYGNVGRAVAQSSHYALDLRAVKSDESNTIVSLRYKALNQVLWTRKVISPQVTWSRDKRAVTVEAVGVPGVWHILVWREGYSLRDFAVSAGYDYSMGCSWSPDSKRLLTRFGMSAMSDFDAGRLFCLTLGQGKTYKYLRVAGNVRGMKWRDNRTVLYRVFNHDEAGTVSRQRRWRAW